VKKFRFKLSALETLRETEVESAYYDLQAITSERRDAEHELLEALRHHSELNVSVSRALADGKGGSLYTSYMAWCEESAKNIAKLRTEIERLRAEEEQLLQAYVNVRRRLDVVREIKNDRKQAYYSRELKKEEQETEDLFNARRPEDIAVA